MNKKLRYSLALFILVSVSLAGTNANAGVLDWLTGKNTKWTFGDVYKTISDARNSDNLVIQRTTVIESQNPITPKRTRASFVKYYVVTATAYSSTVDQTDDTPFITASGTHVRDGVAAANFLPFGTVFKIPDLYGNKIFIVEDRMNRRYQNRVDIWFSERQTALEFGIRQIRIEIVS